MLSKKLLKGIEIIQKMEPKRVRELYGEGHFGEYYLDKNDFSPDERLLIHWITYITNRQMLIKNVWNRIQKVLSFWVKEYKKEWSEQVIKELYDSKKGFKGHDGTFVKSRFYKDDYENIKRTLDILKNYNKSFAEFIYRLLEMFGTEDEKIVRKIASALFLLSYDKDYNTNEALKILSDKNKLENYYNSWEKEATKGKKRLWAAFRDYIKEGSVYREDLLEAFRKMGVPEKYIEFWKKLGTDFLYLNQLELPGDVWNANPEFAREFLKPLAKELRINIKGSIKPQNVSKLVRMICDKLQEDYGKKIYPEQFDFTFISEELVEEFFSEYHRN